MKRVHENISEFSAEAERAYRDRIDLLRSRVSLLTGEDRMLMTMYIKNGNSFRQMARLSGINESRISRRIHKLTSRLMNGEYIRCLRNRDRLEEGELNIAKDYFLDGHSMKKIAKRRGRTYYGVRKTLRKIRGIIALPKAKAKISA